MANTPRFSAPGDDAKALLPVVIIGFLLLVAVMYYGGMSGGFYPASGIYPQ